MSTFKILLQLRKIRKLEAKIASLTREKMKIRARKAELTVQLEAARAEISRFNKKSGRALELAPKGIASQSKVGTPGR